MIVTLRKTAQKRARFYLRLARHQANKRLHRSEAWGHCFYLGLVAAGAGYRIIAGVLCVIILYQLIATHEA